MRAHVVRLMPWVPALLMRKACSSRNTGGGCAPMCRRKLRSYASRRQPASGTAKAQPHPCPTHLVVATLKPGHQPAAVGVAGLPENLAAP